MAAQQQGASEERRRAGRPRVRVLSRDLIVETGLRLMDERGEARIAMRAIASELGVQPSSLYNHVANRAELIVGVRELITDRIDVACFDELPWHEALKRWAASYRAAFAAHPATVALLAVTPLAEGSRSIAMYDAVVRALIRAGWPHERTLSVIVAIEDFLLGAALDTAADPEMLDPGTSGQYPVFEAAFQARRAALQRTDPPELPADAAYRLGLAAIIAGLRTELEEISASTPAE